MPAIAELDRSTIERLVRESLREQLKSSPAASTPQIHKPSSQNTGPNPLVVNVSARHMHVKQSDMDVLFGPGSKLTKLKDLYQPGEFASEQLVNIIGPKHRMITGVRILGPMRDYTQIELSYTDGIYVGIELPLRISGNHDNTPGMVVVGPHGAINMPNGVIRAERHVHMGPADLAHYGVKDGDYMKLKVEGPCGILFDRLKVREHPKVRLEVHIDTDEGNACHLTSATRIELIK